MPVLATIDGGFYKFCLVLHIFCAIVGFGAVFLNGVYGAQMKARMQSGRVAEAIGIYEANETVSKIGEYFIYAVFLLGFARARPERLGVEVLADLGVARGRDLHRRARAVARRAHACGQAHGRADARDGRRAAARSAGPPPQAAEMAALGQKLGVVGPVLDLAMIVVLFLMVFKPGGP